MPIRLSNSLIKVEVGHESLDDFKMPTNEGIEHVPTWLLVTLL